MDYKCYFYMDIPELKAAGGTINTEDTLPFVPYPGLWLNFYGNRAEAAFRVSDVSWHMHDLDFFVVLDAVRAESMPYNSGLFQPYKVAAEHIAPEHVAFWLDFLHVGGWEVETLDGIEYEKTHPRAEKTP